ncbi:spore maturation protein CgeB [Desulfonauticus submarinus]|uniref:Spore maturation protein CgeB n=1 Tax=Desulfonauticus submarinus TaxID=206665 RepID=A0A1G9ZQ28_9BACT|nr:DUF3880 domain-containing protein [Desulfonauticus submarinus]SDN23479.1 spore maturation protein CgeB [Desulfonauticus submarinus]
MEKEDYLGAYPNQFLKKVEEKLSHLSNHLPVFLGYSLKLISFLQKKYKTAAFVVPSYAKEKFKIIKGFLFIQTSNPELALNQLTKWQIANKGNPFLPITIPYFWKKYPKFYRPLFKCLEANRRFNFWQQARYKKFKNKPKILLITSEYFLMGEVITACKRLDYDYYLLHLPNQEIGSEEFVKYFLQAVITFKPDFVLTINHLGVDKEGILIDLLEKMELPLASWFVDNPHLILYMYNKVKSDFTVIFTWDKDNIKVLKEKGFDKVFYLPLATDVQRFNPKNNSKIRSRLIRDVSFVGNSMFFKVLKRREKLEQFKDILAKYEQIALDFKNSDFLIVNEFIAKFFPEIYKKWTKLPTIEDKLNFETLITWQATLEYRRECILEILKFNPLIVGDKGWFKILPKSNWIYHKELNYYSELPFFYGENKINFNSTSAQMKGAVNQRVFDVPASGNFLLTDYREQIRELFEIEKEVVCYKNKDEIEDYINFYLKHSNLRCKIIENARARIIKEHTYEQRLTFLYKTMYSCFS